MKPTCSKCNGQRVNHTNAIHPGLEKYSDIKQTGTGIWYILFSLAYQTKVTPSKKNKEMYLHMLDMLAQGLTCANCRKHFNQFIGTNPPTSAANNDQLMEWTYQCKVSADANGGNRTIIPYDSYLNYFSTLSPKLNG